MNRVLADLGIGNSWSATRKSDDLEDVLPPSQVGTGNSPKLEQPATMCGKKTRMSTGGSNSGRNRSMLPTQRTGKGSGNGPARVLFPRSRQESEFVLIELSDQSRQITLNQLEWSELVSYTGVQLEQVSHGELGMKRAWTLTLRTHGTSSGAATKVKNMLLSMNFEVLSTSHTCSAGWIGTRSEWKLKGDLVPLTQPDFG